MRDAAAASGGSGLLCGRRVGGAATAEGEAVPLRGRPARPSPLSRPDPALRLGAPAAASMFE